MSDITWVITCVNQPYLELLLSWLPERPWPWVRQVLVLTRRDDPDLRRDLKETVTYARPLWPVRVETDDVYYFILDGIDAPPALRTFFEHSLGVKVMVPLLVQPPMLFTDDDVVVTRDPSYIFESGLVAASYSGLDGLTETAKDLATLESICSTFGLDVDLKTYNAGRTDEAVWYLPSIDRDDYAARLRSYFTHPHVVSVSQDMGTAPHGHTQRFRKIGMRFMSGYVIRRGALQLRSPNYRALATKETPKSVPDATFIHYCSSGQKMKYVEWLRGELGGR